MSRKTYEEIWTGFSAEVLMTITNVLDKTMAKIEYMDVVATAACFHSSLRWDQLSEMMNAHYQTSLSTKLSVGAATPAPKPAVKGIVPTMS